MKNLKLFSLAILSLCFLSITSCSDDDESNNEPTFEGQYRQADQMGRPAINTVFVSSANKDMFNMTSPSAQGAKFGTEFQNRLLALNPAYTTNALGLDAKTFTSVLATDVLNVSTTGKTTFFDGTNVLTGRALADDVIDVELLLIFGGTDGKANANLTSDHVNKNDKEFLGQFPYLASPW